MRPILTAVTLCALAAAPAARAGVHMHLPHKHNHPHGEGRTITDAPGSDVPEAVWTRPRR